MKRKYKFTPKWACVCVWLNRIDKKKRELFKGLARRD